MKKINIRKFFSNNFVLLVISFILAFVIWIVINASSTTEQNVTISKIPITIELPKEAVDDGLQVYTGDDITGSVEVSGNSVTVGSLTSEDIDIAATNTSNILTSGSYTLQLAAKKASTKTNYTIVSSSLTPNNITIFVDHPMEKEFEIDNKISFEVPKGFYASSSLSSSKVVITGPETEVSQIATVAVEGKIDGVISASQEMNKALVFLDKDGNPVETYLTKSSESEIKVTLNVLKKLDVKLGVDVINGPKNHPNIELSPSTLSIACTDEAISKIENETISVATVDFSKLTNEDITTSLDLVLPSGCKSLSKINSVTAHIDLSDYIKKELTCSISSDLGDKYNVQLPEKTANIIVFGPESTIKELYSKDVILKPDISKIVDKLTKEDSSYEVPLVCSLSDEFSDCWIYGNYQTNITLSLK